MNAETVKVHLLSEQKAAIALTLSKIRLQAGAESAEHERIIASQKQTMKGLMNENKRYVDIESAMILRKSLSEKERILAAAKAAESTRLELDAAIKYRQVAFADASQKTAKAWYINVKKLILCLLILLLLIIFFKRIIEPGPYRN